MPQCIVQNIIVLVMLVMTVAAPACATLNGDQRFQAVHSQSQTVGYYQLDGRPLRGAPLSTQELQRFLDHSETLLAQLDQCQTASSGPLAN